MTDINKLLAEQQAALKHLQELKLPSSIEAAMGVATWQTDPTLSFLIKDEHSGLHSSVLGFQRALEDLGVMHESSI